MSQNDRDHILFLYRDTKRMVEKAEAHPDKLGLTHAREALRHVRHLMRDYGVETDA